MIFVTVCLIYFLYWFKYRLIFGLYAKVGIGILLERIKNKGFSIENLIMFVWDKFGHWFEVVFYENLIDDWDWFVIWLCFVDYFILLFSRCYILLFFMQSWIRLLMYDFGLLICAIFEWDEVRILEFHLKAIILLTFLRFAQFIFLF